MFLVPEKTLERKKSENRKTFNRKEIIDFILVPSMVPRVWRTWTETNTKGKKRA